MCIYIYIDMDSSDTLIMMVPSGSITFVAQASATERLAGVPWPSPSAASAKSPGASCSRSSPEAIHCTRSMAHGGSGGSWEPKFLQLEPRVGVGLVHGTITSNFVYCTINTSSKPLLTCTEFIK